MGYVLPGSLILSTMIMFTVLGHTLFGFWEIKKNDITIDIMHLIHFQEK